MKVYCIGKRRYVVSFNEQDNDKLKTIRREYSYTNLQIIKKALAWGINFLLSVND